MPELLKAFLLGLVEGATEFIPVSSTGHLIVAADWLDFEGPGAATFEIVIQLGAILAIVWIYRATVLGSITRLASDASARRLWMNLAIAFVPAGIVGFFTHEWIKDVLFDPVVVAVSLVVGGFAILLVERWKPAPVIADVDAIGPGRALGVGLAQILSLVPGVSRSGATIMGGLGLGLSRKAATEFSFFVAIPTMVIATGFELVTSAGELPPGMGPVLAVGFITSFVSAVVVVRAFVRFISAHSFVPFAWYRILFGGALLGSFLL